jgi:ubiquinone/menaquinone biosynthesis C-methylase UbiE
VAGSGENLPFKDGMFDFVIFTLSLHHHQDSHSALAEAQRVLKREGKIIVLEPATDGQFERMCHLFNYEEPQLMEAQDAIRSSSLTSEREEHQRTDWVFDDINSVLDWLYDSYEVAPT